MEKIKVAISSCLLGMPVRYDGKDKLDHYLKFTLGRYIQWIPICPETECGMTVPREPMRLEGNPDSPILITKITKIDKTEMMNNWSIKKISLLKKEKLCGFIFKSHSPSCGIKGVKVYNTKNGSIKLGRGIFADAFIKAFPEIPVEDDERLYNPETRENFIERIVSFKDWIDFIKKRKKIKDLIDFHNSHILQITSHSVKKLLELNSLIKKAELYKPSEIFDRYFSVYMNTLKLKTTKKKHINVFNHIMKDLKKYISEHEKKELIGLINEYRIGNVPLIVLITLFRHYAKKFKLEFKNDFYLNELRFCR